MADEAATCVSQSILCSARFCIDLPDAEPCILQQPLADAMCCCGRLIRASCKLYGGCFSGLSESNTIIVIILAAFAWQSSRNDACSLSESADGFVKAQRGAVSSTLGQYALQMPGMTHLQKVKNRSLIHHVIVFGVRSGSNLR